MHEPVLVDEVLNFIIPEKCSLIVDATLGMGGHTEALLNRAKQAGKTVRIIGLDQDKDALALAHQRLGEQIEYLTGNFADLPHLLNQKKIKQADGILMDLGVSSFQLDTAGRGFSFQQNGPLDMRMDQDQDLTAADIVNRWSEPKLVELFFKYGEERLSRRIARNIVEKRKKEPFYETADLSDLISQVYPPTARFKRPHPATRVFQALRIAVNEEISVLEQGIEGALSLLAPGGVLVVISFHSLEDRIVKQRFRLAASEGGCELLVKKPCIASAEEQKNNPRSRSAKLRAIKRL